MFLFEMAIEMKKIKKNILFNQSSIPYGNHLKLSF